MLSVVSQFRVPEVAVGIQIVLGMLLPFRQQKSVSCSLDIQSAIVGVTIYVECAVCTLSHSGNVSGAIAIQMVLVPL